MTKYITDILLKENDLPKVFKFMELMESSNIEAARTRSDPDTALALFEKYGRIRGYSVRFETSEKTLEVEGIISFAMLYKDTSGAELASKNWLADAKFFMQDLIKVQSLEEIQIPPLGDKTFCCRAKGIGNTAENKGMQLNCIEIDWLRANVLCGVLWVSKDNTVFQADALQICQIQDARLVSLLQEQGEPSTGSKQRILNANVVPKSSMNISGKKPKGSVGWLIFWIVIFWPAAIIYALTRRWK